MPFYKLKITIGARERLSTFDEETQRALHGEIQRLRSEPRPRHSTEVKAARGGGREIQRVLANPGPVFIRYVVSDAKEEVEVRLIQSGRDRDADNDRWIREQF